jgi:nucleotide-binding universal stress UspA family protein
MIALKRILVPTDFSESSGAALAYAREFAKTFGASLHLLHVIQDPYTQPWAAESFPAPLAEMLADWQTQAGARLSALLPEHEQRDAVVATVVGSPFHEIVRYASEHEIDLVVIGTHGRGALGHMLLGSVAEKVVRKAPCPVLTVRHPEREFVK